MPSNPDEWDALRQKIIGLGEQSIQKSYYPELQQQLNTLERFKTLLDQTNDAIFLVKLPSGEIADTNHSAPIQLDYSSEELLKKTIWDIITPEEKDIYENIFSRSEEIPSEHQFTLESSFIKKDSSLIPFEVNVSLVRFSEISYSVMVARDITERKIAENQLKSSLKEKEVLLKEIHHRVKNNLQIISSLLNLQTEQIQDPRDLEIFKESQDRIKSMAIIHEQLYQSRDLAHINFASYIQSMMAHLFNSYSTRTKLITLKTDLDQINFEIDTAIPCGLIINELVSNSLKHAFKDLNSGEISIELKNRDDKYRLVVSDNGVGFELSEMNNSTSLGLKLVRSLVDQLEGELEIKGDSGSEFIITFEELVYNKRL
jgi:PAS domain S-box-containing protein